MNTTHGLATEVPAYAQLQREMHDALLAQHPEWILPNGDCPTCDSYDARLAELLNVSSATERAYEHNKASNILREPWGAVAITRSRPSMRPVISVCLRDMLKQER